MSLSILRRRGGLLTCAILVASAAACGSTVQSTNGVGAQSGTSLDGGSQPGQSGAVAAPGGSTSAPGLPGNTTNVTAPTSPAEVPGATAAPTASGSTSVTAPSTPTTGPIRIGFLNTDIPTKQAADLGVDTGQTYAPKDWFNALVSIENKHGGINGRQIVPVIADVKPLANSWQAEYERACAAFTQDNKVAAVVGYTFVTEDSFLDCLTKARTPEVAIAAFEPDATELSKAPYYFGMGPSKNRALANLLNAPFKAGYLTAKNKIGIVTGSCPNEVRSMKSTWDPLIKKLGLNEAARQTISCPDGLAEGSTTVQQIQAAVLKFRSAGVDRVYTASGALLFFSQTAENQGYHPGYVLDSNTSGGQVEAQQIPKAQLRNMKGYGWVPLTDVGPPRQLKRTPAAQHCLDLYKSAGLVPTRFNDFSNAIGTCDTYFLYKRSVEIGGSTDAARVQAALEGLGSSYASAWTYESRFTLGVGRHDGARRYKPWAFFDDCSCFKYTGGLGDF